MKAADGTRVREVTRLFLRLGVLGFGGPAAHIAMMRDEVVVRRAWIDDNEFLDLVGATNLIPGPNSTELAMHLGAKRAGGRGLVAAGVWTPVLMLTAKSGDLDEAEALDTGADDYLTKPFSFPVLVARVRALLRRAGPHHPDPIEIGPLRLDPGAHRVWHREVEISLTMREFEVLEFLVRRAGLVLTKTEIIDGVWSDDFDGDPNIVEVYIRRLRRKIDEHFGIAMITTVRGTGYRLDSY